MQLGELRDRKSKVPWSGAKLWYEIWGTRSPDAEAFCTFICIIFCIFDYNETQ